MELRVVDSGVLDGVAPAAPLSGGVVWDGRTLLALGPEGVRWRRPVVGRPAWSRSGRRLYVAEQQGLSCLDALTGALTWTLALGTSVRALAAAADGVDVLGGGLLRFVSRYGEVRAERPLPAPTRAIVRADQVRWLGAEDGIWRVEGTDAPRRVYTGVVRGLLARQSGVQALVGDDALFLEEEGLPMVWSFCSPKDTVLLPYGTAAWVACDRATGRGLRIVDARRHTLWRWSGPPVRDVVVAGGQLAIDAIGERPTIGIVGPGLPPLWIAADAPIVALDAEDDLLVVTHAHASRLISFQTEA